MSPKQTEEMSLKDDQMRRYTPHTQWRQQSVNSLQFSTMLSRSYFYDSTSDVNFGFIRAPSLFQNYGDIGPLLLDRLIGLSTYIFSFSLIQLVMKFGGHVNSHRM